MNSKWDDRHYLDAYLAARAGLSHQGIATALGVKDLTLADWVRKRPALKDAIERGRGVDRDPGGSLREYVYGRLPPHLQDLWDRIDLCQEMPAGTAHAEEILSGAGEAARQHLFLYALVHTGFNASEACRRVNVSKARLDGWVRDSVDFAELLDEVRWHKGNYFEGALVELVAAGDGPATIHANKTFNRDRGYADVRRVEQTLSGSVQHGHLHVTVKASELDLPKEVRLQLLQALRAKRGAAEAAANGAAVPAIGQVIEECEPGEVPDPWGEEEGIDEG